MNTPLKIKRLQVNLIVMDTISNCYLLHAGKSSYAFKISEDGLPVHLYWGGRIDRIKDLPGLERIRRYRHRTRNKSILANQEYPCWNGAIYTEPALKVTRPDGARNSKLVFESCETISDETSETLIIKLNDMYYPLEIKLFYRVYNDSSMFDRWSSIVNKGNQTVTLESMMSACFQLPPATSPYRLSTLSGRWGKEAMIGREKITQGKKVLESRTGLSGHFAMPFFALDSGDATEKNGNVRFGTLQWSGNWKIAVDHDGYEHTSVCGGINDFDFSWKIAPGNNFQSPVFSAGYTTKGFGGMTRIIHNHLRRHIEPENMRGIPFPLICNTYAAFNSGPDMNEDNVMALITAAADIGIELFVMDAGWQKSLGEWSAHPEKFSRGIARISKYTHSRGMKFGVWVELESVDLNSEICLRHPDWIMNYPGQPLDPALIDGSTTERALLNLAREDICEYIFESMDKLISENSLDYLKLDMNRYFTSPGWSDAPEEGDKSIWVKYVQNLYSIFERIRSKYPDLIMENCAAGNGRADWGINRLFARVNRSDNQDSLDILKLHEGFSYLHLPKSAGGGCHISDYAGHINARNIPIQFQAFAGMLGSLAIGKKLHELSDTEREELKAYAELYKNIRQTVHNGEFYRLISHYEQPSAAFEYVSRDKNEALIFIFAHALQFSDKLPPVILEGLDKNMLYKIIVYGEDDKGACVPDRNKYPIMSGNGLMNIGLNIELRGDFDTRIIQLNQVNQYADKNNKTGGF